MNLQYTVIPQMEDAVLEAMKDDRVGRNSRSERGWTPPPKDYAEKMVAVFDYKS